MVRGWQSRVEKAGARRVESKQRKQKQINRSTYKAMVQSLLTSLEKHSPIIRRHADPSWKFHVWTDSMPSDNFPLLHENEETDRKVRRPGRSFSIGEEPKSKSKSKSDSCDEISGSGKKDPSGKLQSDTLIDTPRTARKNSQYSNKDVNRVDDDGVDTLALCKSQFYTGKCDDIKGGKKSSCRYFHYPKHHNTLADVLKTSKRNTSEVVKEMLAMSEQSYLEAIQDEGGEEYEVGGMEMLYYSEVALVKSHPDGTTSNDNKQMPSANAILSKAMADKSIVAANVVYVTINDVLIFDRYRDGVIISDHTMMTSVLGDDNRRSRSMSLAVAAVLSEGEGNQEYRATHEPHTGTSISLPCQVLEYILTYLPDPSVAVMCRVCQAWNTEIKSSSPELWRHMLRRRGWPVAATAAADDDIESLRDQLRSDFLLHYGVVRDMEAVKDAVSALIGSGKKTLVEETEMVYQSFSTRRTAPQEPNGCIGVEIWSRNHMIVAYAHDCTLRLFQAVDKTLEGGSPRSCRELVCVCVDPYRKTKKQVTTLIAMGLDDARIGCLCRIKGRKSESYILAVISRDEYLSSDGNSHNDTRGSVDLEDGVLKVISIGDAVLNYLVSLDGEEGHVPQLSAYLAGGGNMDHVQVVASQSLIACGSGRFMTEVSVLIPEENDYGNGDGDDDGAMSMMLVGRRLVLVCAARGAIIWMHSTYALNDTFLNPSARISAFGVKRRYGGDGRCVSCTLAFSSYFVEEIMILNIESTSHGLNVQSVYFLEPEVSVWSDFLDNGWVLNSSRPVAITLTDIVVLDCLCRQNAGERTRYRSIISFYPRQSNGDLCHQTIELDGNNCQAVQICDLRDHHVVILCRIFTSDCASDGDPGLDDVDGHWFSEPSEGSRTFAILLHVPTRREIERVFLSERDLLAVDVHPCQNVHLLLTGDGDTVGAGLSWKGVIMSGSDVRDLGEYSRLDDKNQLKLCRKKNKNTNRKRKPNGKSKLDGFARGMSMQG